MSTDKVADLLTRMRNAISAWHVDTTCPYSWLKEDILKVFKKEKFISDYSTFEEWKFKFLKIVFADREILGITKVSKPGQRIYKTSTDIKSVMNWYWISVISTSEWVMAWYEAFKKWIGWELICEIY